MPAAQHRAGATVLVTGASSGIGQATAAAFARAGFRVFGTSRRQLPGRDGTQMLELDVRSGESVQHCVREVLARAGQIDVLVSNAGVMHQGIAEETTAAEAEAVFGVNLFGTARVIDAVLPGMRERRSGRIINVGSLAAWLGEPGEGIYAASKAALARYTEALRHEVWHCGIRVSLVEPGAFATGVMAAASVSRAAIADYDGIRESARRTMQEALRKGGGPERLADLIVAAARSRQPRARYGAGREARWVPAATVLLPRRLLDRLVRRGFGLPG